MKVQTTDGHTLRVTRRWFPWRRRLRVEHTPDVPGSNMLTGLGDDPFSIFIALLLLPFLLPLIGFLIFSAVELLLVWLLLVPVMAARSVFGVPWVIEVQPGWVFSDPIYEERVRGFRASGRRLVEIAHWCSTGAPLPPPPPAPPRGTWGA